MNFSTILQEMNIKTKSIVLENIGVSKPVVKIDATTGEILRTYTSIAEAAMDVGINRKGISDVLKGKQKTAGGFIWQFDIEDTVTSIVSQEDQQ